MTAAIGKLLREGGPVLAANLALAALLYGQCCGLLLRLRGARRRFAQMGAEGAAVRGPLLRLLQVELQDFFRRKRLLIGAMIAAAPLLGLLGTVAGMIGTFESLAGSAAQSSMGGLAGGISEALLNTEAGLAVAIPALLLLYLGHRQTEKGLRELASVEARAREAL
jgi:biopolymer transport protein ExbB/TolQ